MQVQVSSSIGPAEVQAKITAPGVGVVNQPVTFDSSQSTSTNPIVGAAWDFGDGQSATGTTVNHAYAAKGTYQVFLTLTDNQGNQSAANHTITINDDPNAPAPDIAVSPSNQVLAGTTVTFDGSNSQPANLPDDAFVWHFGDGTQAAVGKTVQHVYQAAGNFTAKLTLTSSGQTAEASTNMDVQANNPPQPIITGPDQAETGQTVTFNAAQTKSSSAIVRYEWDFGDGTTASDPSVDHVYQAAGTYNVSLTVTDQQNLHGTTQKSIVVTDPQVTPSQPPTAMISPPPAAEAGQPVTFDGNGSQPGDHPLAGYAWDFGDGSPAASGATVQHTYNQAGAYNVTLTVTDDQGVPNSTSAPVTVNPAPPTQPVVPAPQAVINAPASGTTANVGDNITFDGSGSVVQGQNVSYAWDFGDGTQGSGPTTAHVYNGPGSYNVTLAVTNESGSNFATTQITVNDTAQTLPQPQPQPTAVPNPPVPVITGPSQGQVGEGLLFDASYSRSDSPIVSYVWDYGDGITENGGMGMGHSYNAPGAYVIHLTVTDMDGLTGQATYPVTIVDVAVPPLQPVTPVQPVDTPVPAQPTDTPIPAPTDTPVPVPTDTPVPVPTDTPVPVPTDTPVPVPTDTPIPPPPPPTADINGPIQGAVGDNLQFDGSGSSGNGLTYQWDFGDGTQGNGSSVNHSYAAAGSFVVTLTVSDPGGSDSTSITVTIQ
jgi:large repetitive protein